MAKRTIATMSSAFFLPLCLGAFFVCLGVMGITHYNSNLSSVMRFLGKNDSLNLVMSIVEIVMGGILVLGIVFPFSPSLSNLIGIVLFALWAFYIVFAFFMNDAFKPNVIEWLYSLSWHAVILVALWSVGRKQAA